MTAFVLGNGVSRADISIPFLLEHGFVYGCNALYRTDTPTALIATDKPIAEEIQRSGYALRNRFHTRRPLPDLGALPVPEEYFGFSSGPLATGIAARDGQQPIYLLGFDMGPGLDGRFNNLYADTQFYKALGTDPTYAGNWVRQLVRIIKDHPTQQFYRVHGTTTAYVPEFDALSNMSKLTIDEFFSALNKPKDS